MKKFNKFISIIIIFSLFLPFLAEAKAGSSYRSGSSYRGSRGGYGGFQQPSSHPGGYNYRSQSPYGQSRYTPPPAYQSRSTGTSFFSGLFTGLLGGYLYNKIFNKGEEKATTTNVTDQNKAASQQPIASGEGNTFLRVILIIVVAYLLWRLIRRRRVNKDRTNYLSQDESQPSGPMNMKDFINLSKPTPERNVTNLSQEDHNSFEKILTNVQNAWSGYDLRELRRVTTPEMYEHFAGVIRENQQVGIKNHVSNVRLLNQELEDTWQEGDRLFARVALTWSAIDYAVNERVSEQDPGYLIEGNMTEPAVSTEIWTFEKTNGTWILAGIDQ